MDLYIIGAGKVGGFIAYHAHQMGDYLIKGFLDDDHSKHQHFFYGIPVVGAIDKIIDTKEELAVAVAIGDPTAKQNIVKKLKNNKLIQFPVFIHPKAWLGAKVVVGEGSIIYPGVSINYETEVGSFVIINMNSAIGHNSKIENFSTISPGVNCGGGIHLNELCFMGIGSAILPSIKIGKGTTIGAGAVIYHDIPDNVTVINNQQLRIIKK